MGGKSATVFYYCYLGFKFGVMRDIHNAGLRGRLPLFKESFLKKDSFMFD